MTFLELFDIHTIICGFRVLRDLKVFSIFISYSKHKRLFFSTWVLGVKVTSYSKIIYFALIFMNMLIDLATLYRL